MDKKTIIVSLCALIMLFVVATTPTGFVIHSNSCCTNPDLCSEIEICDNINPDLEKPTNVPIGTNAKYAIGILLLFTCIGIIHKTIGPKEKR